MPGAFVSEPLATEAIRGETVEDVREKNGSETLKAPGGDVKQEEDSSNCTQVEFTRLILKP